MNMRKLYVQEVSRKILCDKWGCAESMISNEVVFVRSNAKGDVNWDKTTMFLWRDLENLKFRRHIVFTNPAFDTKLSINLSSFMITPTKRNASKTFLFD